MNNLENHNQEQNRMEIPELYEAPAIEVIEVEVEGGFGISIERDDEDGFW